MLAIDTNVVVRLLVRDHPDQTALAEALVATEDISISTTVVLEAAWVLSNVYHLGRNEIAAGLEALAGLPKVSLDNPGAVQSALGWYRAGLDFADALHLAQAANGFATFDRQLVRRARGLQPLPLREL